MESLPCRLTILKAPKFCFAFTCPCKLLVWSVALILWGKVEIIISKVDPIPTSISVFHTYVTLFGLQVRHLPKNGVGAPQRSRMPVALEDLPAPDRRLTPVLFLGPWCWPLFLEVSYDYV